MLVQWTIFILCSLAVILAGMKLARYGDAIGKRSGIGQGWIGLLFLATVTSIPELTVTITGAAIDVPDISVGNALGSNLFNLAIIAVIDIVLLGRGPFLRKVKSYHIISGGSVVLLTVLAIFGIAVFPEALIFGISPVSLAILMLYLFFAFVLFRVERKQGPSEEQDGETLALKQALIGFVASSVVIVVAGIFLTYASKSIASSSALSGSLIGAFFVAIVTSLPELATSIGALRIRGYDMIMGNLFGSNMFNILTIFFADLAFHRGSIFAGLAGEASNQLVIGLFGVVMAVIAMISIAYRTNRKLLGMGIDAFFLLVAYMVSVFFIAFYGIDF
jgi:cation:H+ antiporter